MNITNESKGDITITNDSRQSSTWDEATFTWDQAEGTWSDPGIIIVRESKNSVTITNETK